jgi:cell division protein FtsQ
MRADQTMPDAEDLRPNRALFIAHRLLKRVSNAGLPRHGGSLAAVAFLGAAFVFAVIRGGHGAEFAEAVLDARNALGNAAGFRIEAVAITGQTHVTEEELLVATGVTGNASLLFLDADAARARLKAIPWIADAQVRKLYPDRLEIAVTERQVFGLWQNEGTVSLIAGDGTVVGGLDRRFAHLPLVVGKGANMRARALMEALEPFPSVREEMRAAVLVAERRWNLRMKNGVDIRLPEGDIAPALTRFVEMERNKKLLSRDIVAIDLRLPDRVTVRLSDEAASQRIEAFKERTKKKGSGA